MPVMAATATEDAQGRRVFADLAEDERQHEDFLKKQYDALKTTGSIDASISLPPAREFPTHHPIFSAELQKRASSAHYEMSALSVGIQLEMSSIKFYEGEAAAIAEAPVRDFYQKLAAWEREHLFALQRQADELKEDYWRDAGFSPF